MLCLISVTGVKHLPALLAKNFQRRPPIFLHVFSRAPTDLQLCFVQLKTLAPTFKYPVTLKPGNGSFKVMENYTTKSGTHDFVLTFHSHRHPISHRFRDISHFRRKLPIFLTPCIKRPRWMGSPWNLVSA